MFPHLLKSAEIRLEVIAGMSMSSEEPGNCSWKLPRRQILSGGCGWGVTVQAVLAALTVNRANDFLTQHHFLLDAHGCP